MEEEVTLEHEGQTYLATYTQYGDELVTYLPDGSNRSTTLRGLDAEQAATTHLRSYIKNLKPRKEQ